MFKNLSASALGVSGHQSEIIELALTFGFQGIDVDLSEFATRVRLHGVAHARRLLDSARLRPGPFALPIELDADDAVFSKQMAKLAELTPIATQAGCTCCVTTLAPASDTRPYHENFEFHRQRLQAVATLLTPAGIRLGVGFRAAEYLRRGKTFQFIHDLDALTLLASMAGSANIGILLDVWELVVGGASVESIRKLQPAQLVAVQVANVPADVAMADLNEDSRLLPGVENGRIDMVAVLQALADLKYDGPVTPIPSSGLTKTMRRDLVVKEAGESLGKAWKAAGISPTAKAMAGSRA